MIPVNDTDGTGPEWEWFRRTAAELAESCKVAHLVLPRGQQSPNAEGTTLAYLVREDRATDWEKTNAIFRAPWPPA